MQRAYNAPSDRHIVVVVRDTCGACQMLFQHLHALLRKGAALPGDIWLVRTEHVAAVPALAGANVQSVPTFFVVQDGAVVTSKAGVHPSADGMLDVMRGMLHGQ
uniref:Thioredoxin domain-containing protein n=1 Tax=viral metagenome TaxID=1070528 RepID=A0A6C0AST2_9ZZZZ